MTAAGEKELNAAIVVLPDGAPCIVIDQPMPHPIAYVQFDYADHCVSLMYAPPNKGGYKLAYPLDSAFVDMLKDRPAVGVAVSKNNEINEVSAYPVAFINS